MLNLRSTLLTLAGGDAMPSAAISKLLSMRTGQGYAEFAVSSFGTDAAIGDTGELPGKWGELPAGQPRHHDLRRHVGGAAQHHRRTAAGSAPRPINRTVPNLTACQVGTGSPVSVGRPAWELPVTTQAGAAPTRFRWLTTTSSTMATTARKPWPGGPQPPLPQPGCPRSPPQPPWSQSRGPSRHDAQTAAAAPAAATAAPIAATAAAAPPWPPPPPPPPWPPPATRLSGMMPGPPGPPWGPKVAKVVGRSGCGAASPRGAAEQHRSRQRAGTHCTGGRLRADRSEMNMRGSFQGVCTDAFNITHINGQANNRRSFEMLRNCEDRDTAR